MFNAPLEMWRGTLVSDGEGDHLVARAHSLTVLMRCVQQSAFPSVPHPFEHKIQSQFSQEESPQGIDVTQTRKAVQGPQTRGFSVWWSPMGSLSPLVWSGRRVGRKWCESWSWPLGNAGWGRGPSMTGCRRAEGPSKGCAEVPKRSSPTSVLLRDGLNF